MKLEIDRTWRFVRLCTDLSDDLFAKQKPYMYCRLQQTGREKGS